MSDIRLRGVSLNAVADVSHDGRCIQRILSFADGQKKVLGCIFGAPDVPITLTTSKHSSERVEIVAGDCMVFWENGEQAVYRSGQSFVVGRGQAFTFVADGVMQYMRHLEF